MIFYDTETCGLHGVATLIQWALDDGPVHLHEVWKEPVRYTVSLIDRIVQHDVCGFHLTFDHFHLCKLRTIFSRIPRHWIPEEHIDEIADQELLARDEGCLKQKAAVDLLVLASQGKYQALVLENNEIRIRSVPQCISKKAAVILNEYLSFPDIYFARKKDPSIRFQTLQGKRKGFDDIVLKFAPSRKLKHLVKHLCKAKVMMFEDIMPDEMPQDKKKGYRPFGMWRDYIESHIEWWQTKRTARLYAQEDVEHVRALWNYFDCPPAGDRDSDLACMIGAVRWHGFTINKEKTQAYLEKCAVDMVQAPRDPRKAKPYIEGALDDAERSIAALEDTSKETLKDFALTFEGHQAGTRALAVLAARRAKYDHDMCRKLLEAGRFHAAATVVGTLSGRKSGRGGDFNSQGISKNPDVRELFTFAWPGMILCGGDFDQFEITIADAYFKDPVLHEELLTGVSIHGQLGSFLYEVPYEEIMATKKQKDGPYSLSKIAVFRTLYGGTPAGAVKTLGITAKAADVAYDKFLNHYKMIGVGRQAIFDDFTMLTQPGGTGTAVILDDPERVEVESILGFKRSFSPQFDVIKAIHKFAQFIPRELCAFDDQMRVKRSRDRRQTPSGALSSSLYSTSFSLQGEIQRAANNHVIQSSGAEICKGLEHAVWSLQPHGYNPWKVAPINLHDELQVVCHPDTVDELTRVVENTVEEYRKIVPLLAMDWETNKENWSS